MPSINTISAFISGQSKIASKGANLSEETIGKLLSLGIDIESVSSEAEAKRIIEEEEQKSKPTKTTDEEEKSSQSEAETLYNDIKNLARKLGIDVSKSENIEDILDKISSKLESLQDNSYNSNLNVFQSELDMLKRQFKNLYAGESSILSAMDLLSQNNRAVLGI